MIADKIEPHIIDIIKTLSKAGYETYLVGGAIRDLLNKRQPKDYDISTAATPEEIRKVFRKRRVLLIGRRFRLAHLYYSKTKYIEISTFRSNPNSEDKAQYVTRDNNYGSSYEDAWRRDFTVNAIFYDPLTDSYVDHTDQGLLNLKQKLVVPIGDPAVRFAEDPVRMLRALKLVAECDFKLCDELIEVIPQNLQHLIPTSKSRLMLEFEKILRKGYSDKVLTTFRDYGLLKYFLPYFDKHWNDDEVKLGIKLLENYNIYSLKRGLPVHYTTSIVFMMIPILSKAINGSPTELRWEYYPGLEKHIAELIRDIFHPFLFPKFRIFGVVDTLLLAQKMIFKRKLKKGSKHRYYNVARDVSNNINKSKLFEF